ALFTFALSQEFFEQLIVWFWKKTNIQFFLFSPLPPPNCCPQVSDLVIILNHERAVEAFAKGGNLTLGGNFTVAIGPLG
ncbi:putative SH3 domain-containing YSC84-like protein, partial [Naja naja]